MKKPSSVIILFWWLSFLPLLTFPKNPEPDSLKKKFLVVKFAPLTFLDVDAGLQIGIENKILKFLSIQNEFGYLFLRYRIYDILEVLDSSYSFRPPEKYYFRGFSYKSELRFYFFTESAFQGFYFAPQFMYKKDEWKEKHWVNSEEVELPNSKIIFQENLKLGFQHIFARGFSLDIFAGAGIKERTLGVIKVNNYYSRYLLVSSVTTEKQQRVYPALTAGFKMGWAF